MTSDEQLILEFQAGATEAFEEIFERYRQSIWAFFRRRLNDPSRAEELAQETFLAVLKGAARYQPRARFRSYLYAIALNLLHAEQRAAQRDSSRGATRDVDQIPASADPAPAIVLQEAVAQLDEPSRQIILRREYEQLSYDEIAAVLSVPVNTVRSRLFRARMALKALLADRADASREARL